MEKKIYKALRIIGICFLIFGGSAGVTHAFLSKQIQRADNVITPGNIKIQLKEPGWDPEKAKKIIPLEMVDKDPLVINTGENDAWIFLRVDVPVRIVSVVDQRTKLKQEAAATELFSWVTEEDWDLIDRSEDDANAHYVFGYKKILSAGEQTNPLFRQVSLVNVLEGELDANESFELSIEAAAIQTNTALDEQGLTAIYSEYLNQETM